MVCISLSRLGELFEDNDFKELVRRKLPVLFKMAHQDIARGDKAGMEVGTLREQILIAMLMCKFGEENIDTSAITDPEVDVKLFGEPISIKTKTGTGDSGVKACWTVDQTKARAFIEHYTPSCELLLVEIGNSSIGKMYFIPLGVQSEIFNRLGCNAYFKMPPPGTNPRGVEFSKEALKAMKGHARTKSIEIRWNRVDIDYTPYERWLNYWRN